MVMSGFLAGAAGWAYAGVLGFALVYLGELGLYLPPSALTPPMRTALGATATGAALSHWYWPLAWT